MKIEIWDKADKAPENQNIIKWNEYFEKNGQFSVLKAIEENSDWLRSTYVTFVCDIGKLKIMGKRLAKHLELDSGFNLWWMSLPAEKSTFKSPGILDALRLYTTGEELCKRGCETLCYIGAKVSVAESLRYFCEQNNLRFVFQKETELSPKPLLGRIWRLLPGILQSLIYLAHYFFNHLKLKKKLHGLPHLIQFSFFPISPT
jgi:surface carbohydrate biosynthesis protein (TIGR04326 family)